MKFPGVFSAVLFASSLCLHAQFKMEGKPGEAPGPWIFGTVGVGKGPDAKTPKTTALKGLAIKVGEHGEAAVCYDLDLCRMAGAWTGGKFTTPMNLMSRGEYPTALGETAFTAGDLPGFITGAAASQPAASEWKDLRSEPYGPLPDVHFKGMYVNGSATVLKWEIGGAEVLETPAYSQQVSAVSPSDKPTTIVSRTISAGPTQQPLLILAGPNPEKELDIEATLTVIGGSGNAPVGYYGENLPSGSRWRTRHGHLFLQVPPLAKRTVFRLGLVAGPVISFPSSQRGGKLGTDVALPDPEALTHGGPAHWPEPVVTQGEVAAAAEPQSGAAYVVDTIKLPDPNPWNAPLFVGGFDFFPDGRAALCTFHGDVFIASGIDDKLNQVTWRRFASGLYHALGLKIVNGDIYVTCRDGVTRLKDLNGDGEADFYERFNNDIKVTKSFHEFVFDLQADSQGNFYFAKAGPVKNGGRGFDEICEHHGCLFRLSPDGKKLNVVATGFRAPNGIGCSPDGQLTSGDNEGTWTPVCKINWIKDDGFYGVVDLAHRNPPPTDYDRPLCWLPKRADNSSGSQVWVPDDKRWGPWRGQLLHLSYGTCSLFGVMREEVPMAKPTECCDRIVQGGVTQFPLKFQSGIMRARFNPVDGQLYVAGLRGWQTTGLKNGCFQRVRYTGAPVRMPIELHAKKDGVEVRFTSSLDTNAAANPENWNVEAWNYIWSSAYGSPEVSTQGGAETPTEIGKDGKPQFTAAQMAKKGHDALTVKAVHIGTDDRTVFLEIPGMKPVMQMSIKYQIKSADGADLKGEVLNTIHALGAD